MDKPNRRPDPAGGGRFKRPAPGVVFGICASLAAGLTALAGAGATRAETTTPAEPGAVCRLAEEPGFRCTTKTGGVLTLCADPTAHSVRLLREQAGKRSLIADGPPAQKVWPGKGFSTILQWGDGPTRWTLFVDGVPADHSGFLTQGADGAATLREECKDGAFEAPDGRERASPSGHRLNVFSLPEFGLSRPLEQPPSWPK